MIWAWLLARKPVLYAVGGAVAVLILAGLFILALHRAENKGYAKCEADHTTKQQAADLVQSLKYNKAQDTLATIQAGIETKRQTTNVIIKKSNDGNIPAVVLSDTVDSLYQ